MVSKIAATMAFTCCAASAQFAVGVRVQLGVNDTAETKWDGKPTAQGAKIAVAPWRFEKGDTIAADGSWRCSTHPIRLYGQAAENRQPIVANGVILWLDQDDDTVEVQIKTEQGEFSLTLADIPYGVVKRALDGRVAIDRVPAVTPLAAGGNEQDYPVVAAGKNGTAWLAYVEFVHHPQHDLLRTNLPGPPKNFEPWRAPTGGDQIWAVSYTNGIWNKPVAISGIGEDSHRPAIAVDGSGNAWVFWPEQRRGNFDLWTRYVEPGGRLGPVIRLSSEFGADVNPVAATDAGGRVWVAWQAWRNGRASIVGATQKTDRFTPFEPVSMSTANEWNPAIAADSTGRVTVAWDSYRNGNYDVYMRTADASGAWGKEVAAAASAAYEAYPSIAYDPAGRLWIAYEEDGEQWGKSVGLYQGRRVRLRGFERDGRAVELKTEPQPGASSPQAPRNSLPRLTIDASGRIWLAIRSSLPLMWSPIGTVWSEHLISYDGDRWTGPIFLMHTDNILDNRPALVSLQPGQLLMAGSADGRRQFFMAQFAGMTEGPLYGTRVKDPFNNDLYSQVVRLPPASKPIEVKEATARAVVSTVDKAEEAAIASIRKARVKTASAVYEILRGGFPGPSEISVNGGDGGTLADQWRYALDVAGLDWVGCCDRENGERREYSFWGEQKLTDMFYTPGRFVPMYSYERGDPGGGAHRNMVFAARGVRPMPHVPDPADLRVLYDYVKAMIGVVASSSKDEGKQGGEADPVVEFIDAGGRHPVYWNVLAKVRSREAVLEGLRQRHVYVSSGNVLAEFRCGDHMMGDAFTVPTAPELRVKIWGAAPFTKVEIVKDGKTAHSVAPKKAQVEMSWRDADAREGKTSQYSVRAEQEDGGMVQVSPMWITYKK